MHHQTFLLIEWTGKSDNIKYMKLAYLQPLCSGKTQFSLLIRCMITKCCVNGAVKVVVSAYALAPGGFSWCQGEEESGRVKELLKD